jgi:hypothetical protein
MRRVGGMLPGSTCRSGCTCHDASDAVLEKHGVVPALRNGRKEEYSVAVDTRRPVPVTLWIPPA